MNTATNNTAAPINVNNVVIDGKEVELVSGTANFGSPEYYEFVPSYMTTSGAGEVSSRFTTTGFFRDADGNTVKYRLNLWGKEAEEAKAVLMDSRRVATINVHNARVSRFTDRNGIERASVNINSKNEYEVVRVARPQADSGFAAAAARAENEAFTDAPF